jgi:serine/threonine-protein kinase RsbW
MPKVNNDDIIWEYDDSLSSNAEAASGFVRQIAKKLNQLDWPESDIFAVHMALEEALINAIKHGNRLDASKPVKVLVRIHQYIFYARIQDQGPGFDPDAVPDPSDDANLDKTSGRGVALIKNFVDFVEYNSAGNAVEFRKSRSSTN